MLLFQFILHFTSMLMAIGIMWVLLSVVVNAMRVKGLHLLERFTYISWIPPKGGSLLDIDIEKDEM